MSHFPGKDITKCFTTGKEMGDSNKARAEIMCFVAIFPNFILDINKVIYHQIE